MMKRKLFSFHEYVKEYTQGTVEYGAAAESLWFSLRDTAITLPWFFRNRPCSWADHDDFLAGDRVAQAHNFMAWYSWWLRGNEREVELSCNSRPKHRMKYSCGSRLCPFCLLRNGLNPLVDRFSREVISEDYRLCRARLVCNQESVFSQDEYKMCSDVRRALSDSLYRRGIRLTSRLSVYRSGRLGFLRPEIDLLWWGLRQDEKTTKRLTSFRDPWRCSIYTLSVGSLKNIRAQVGLFWRYPGWVLHRRYTQDLAQYEKSPFYTTRVK